MSTESARQAVASEDRRWFKASTNSHEWPISGDVWLDMSQVDANSQDILGLARRFTRLTMLALNGLLIDADGVEVNRSDLRLIQEVAYAADACLSEAGKRYLAADGTERPILTEPVRRAVSS